MRHHWTWHRASIGFSVSVVVAFVAAICAAAPNIPEGSEWLFLASIPFLTIGTVVLGVLGSYIWGNLMWDRRNGSLVEGGQN